MRIKSENCAEGRGVEEGKGEGGEEKGKTGETGDKRGERKQVIPY